MDLLEQEVAALLHSATRGNDTLLTAAFAHFSDIPTLVAASSRDWTAFELLTKTSSAAFKDVLQRIRCGRLSLEDRKIIDLLRDLGVQVLTQVDAAYPTLLHQIPDPPPVLYRRGIWQDLNTPQIAMVGARKASPQAQKLAQTYARELAANGLVVTSGMAVGIDAFAHAGALESGHTIAVLGTGIDKIYPSRHHRLAQQILSQGCLLSDHPIGTGPTHYTFPKRNRIVSGLSRLVIVVEAARNSGSLITARHALDQNKELMVFPWSALHSQGLGCLDLMIDGAGVIRDFQDVWLTLAKTNLRVELQSMPVDQVSTTVALSPECERLLGLIGDTPVSSVDLSARVRKPITWVQEHLLELELANCIAASGFGYVRL
ncbi:MAG: DNA-processing protein DprA [Halieaceae bacterium]|nr:DNA-processing protein DprA [Halieaceae bacterium]